ncbi:hypothetical protein [Streptomyces syringium]|uniref:hypothetical protein n=1 Tax=Streptomyces syringium TaxID=76729 RepID=UPI0033DBD534
MRKPLGERQRGRVRLGRRLALLGAVISFGAFALSMWARQDWPGPGLAWTALLAVTLAGVALLLTLPPRPRRAAVAGLSVAVFFVLAWATAVLFEGGGNDDVGSAPPTSRVETPWSPDSMSRPPAATPRPATPRPTEARPTDPPTSASPSTPPAAATPAEVAPPPPTGGDGTGSAAMITAVGGLVTAISGCVTAAAALKQANTTARQAAAAAQAPASPDP